MRAGRLLLVVSSVLLFAACAGGAPAPIPEASSPGASSVSSPRIRPGPTPYSPPVTQQAGPQSGLPSASDIRTALDAAAFVTPSGQIVCELLASGARCDYYAQDRTWEVPEPANCDRNWGWSLFLDRAAAPNCVGDTIVLTAALESGFDTWRRSTDPTVSWNGIPLAALPYGSALVVDTFRCDSAAPGVTCQNQSTGHGFFMSRESYTIF